MNLIQALFIGLAQALAVLPGFSRSGWTIAVGLYCGLAPRSAVYFSFLISLPAILGSTLVDWIGILFKNSSQEHSELLFWLGNKSFLAYCFCSSFFEWRF